MMLFRVKDTKTGKLYKEPWLLCKGVEGDESLNPEVLHPGIRGGTHISDIFIPHQFYLDDEGDLYIEGSTEYHYLPRERFKPVFNMKSPLLKVVTIIGGKSACDAVLVGIENHLFIPPVEDVDE